MLQFIIEEVRLMNDCLAIGQRIERARELHDLSMEDLANRIGVAKSTIQRYEKGKITNIKLPIIESIARALDVNPSWIIGKTDKMELDSPLNMPAYMTQYFFEKEDADIAREIKMRPIMKELFAKAGDSTTSELRIAICLLDKLRDERLNATEGVVPN
jgi:transcriptional regulator with XRE-family HTH domain